MTEIRMRKGQIRGFEADLPIAPDERGKTWRTGLR